MLFVNRVIEILQNSTDCDIEQATLIVSDALDKAGILDGSAFLDYCKHAVSEWENSQPVLLN